MAPARILVSTLIASPDAAHGGPVVSRRHAAALARQGHEVCIAAPDGEPYSTGDHFRVEIYSSDTRRRIQFGARRPDPVALAAVRALVERFRPDILYDVHGPAWAIDAAWKAGVPVVSMIGDYNWFCLQSFLVDSRLKRCSGPETADKCFGCLNHNYAPHRRAIQRVLQPAARDGHIRLELWDAVVESRAYGERLRPQVSAFVVGDRQAHEFLLGQGIPAHKIARIAQGLPAEARVSRRKRDGGGAPVRERPLRLGFVGRPHLDKGIHVLARAFDCLPRTLPLELWIIHAQLATPENLRPHFPSGARFDADLAGGRVKLLRPATRDGLFELMAQVDVGVVPSLAYESPSLAMLEFVAQGTPVVRSESRGMEHVIRDGVNGRTFPYGDAQALAAVIREIVAVPSSIDRWRAALPTVAGDDEYAQRLSALFASLGARDPIPEAAMA